MKTLKTWAAAAAMVALAGTAQAGLELQSNKVEVLDTDTKLLWLYDWNSSGLKSWADANIWAAGLTAGGAKAGEWRLPERSEYEDLWAEVGGTLIGLQAEFINIQPFGYWSGTENTTYPDLAWVFLTSGGGAGFSSSGDKRGELYAVAVRSVDEAAPVPEPQTLALVLLALGASVVARRTRPR